MFKRLIAFALSVSILVSMFSGFSFASDDISATDVKSSDVDFLTTEEAPAEDFYYDTYDTYCVITGYSGYEANLVIPSEIDGLPVQGIGDYAFSNTYFLETIVLPEGLTSIGESAFSYCDYLTDITIPDTVTTIAAYAFSGCGSLESIDLPAGLTSISNGLLSYCYNLKSITIPAGVTEIFDYAFEQCSALESISVESGNTVYKSDGNCLIEIATGRLILGCKNSVIPTDGSVKIIGASAFFGCTELTSITIPDSVVSIEDQAFYYTGLTDVVLPDSVTEIGSYAFQGCNSLETVVLSENITSIPSSAFYGCSSLASITIPEGIVSIDQNAFSYCTSLIELKIPASVTSIASSAFTRCKGLETIEVASGNEYYIGSGNCLIEKESGTLILTCKNSVLPTDGSLKKIINTSFSNRTDITEVKIPASVTSIDASAFSDCNNIASIEVEAGNSVYFSSGNCIIETATKTLLRGCNNSVIPADGSVTVIGKYAFQNCRQLQEIIVPSCVVEIGDSAFRYCTSLSKVTIPDSVNKIGIAAFSGCDSLKSITIPESITVISPDAFYFCNGLEEVNLPETLTTIESYAFASCSALKEIVIPDNVSYIGYNAFGSCSNLTNITLPANLTEIESGTFSYCDSLTDIIIPSNVTYIKDSAFAYCGNLQRITIPVSVTNIDYSAFSGCYALTDVYYNGTSDQWYSIYNYSDELNYATIHFGHECQYTSTVVAPTYTEKGYTLHECSVCGNSYKDTYVDALTRIQLSEATVTLEYTEAFYRGETLTPAVTITYGGETYDSATELKVTYSNNNSVGTATVTVEGINKFQGSVELEFEISYEEIPAQIVNVIAVSEIGKISLSWGKSSEVNTTEYKIYRKAADESDYTLIATVSGRDTLSYEDKAGEKGESYSYYVTGVGLYGAESEPSLEVSGTVLIDKVAPVILKIYPESATVIAGETTFSVTATDNMAIEGVAFAYSSDNGTTWNAIAETANGVTDIAFDTAVLSGTAVRIKAVAYDAEGNMSEPLVVVYSLDNVGPEKVTGLSAVTLPSKITLSWEDVSANDAAYFILQTKLDGNWVNVTTGITTLGYTITGLMPDTEYTYRVACVDTHNNIGEYSDEFTATTQKDTTAPVITNQSPASARFNKTINYTVTVKDDCNIQYVKIQTSKNLVDWTDVTVKEYTDYAASRLFSYTLDLAAYSEGSLYVRGVAIDFTGNVSDTGSTAPYSQYIVDKTAPSTPTGVKANGHDGYVTVAWTLGNELDLGSYSVYRASSADGTYQLIASGLTTINYNDSDVDVGEEFYYKVRVSDTCGNISDYSTAVSATVNEDTEKPKITGISTTYMNKISEKYNVIGVSANDNNKLSKIVVEYCTSKNTEYVELIREENINSSYKNFSVQLPMETLSDGDIIFIRVYAVDMAGFVSDYATSNFTVDNTAPEVSDFTMEAEGKLVSLSWKDCGETDLSGFRVYRSSDGENFTQLGSRGVSSSGSYTFKDSITAKESGTYTYKLEAIDKVGNASFETITYEYAYVYINEAPVAKMNIPDFAVVAVEEIYDASGSSDDIAISSYLWDFGDGTTSTEVKPVKKYDETGTYTVTLTVTDNEGVATTVSKEIQVKDRESVGVLNVQVRDDSGNTLPYVPVYFDLGSENQKIVYTDGSGIATLQMVSGSHVVGMYSSGYLPVKKEVTVLANATRTITLITVEEDIVTGEFEITRMTFDEIVAAGIDVYDPANQNVYSATIRVSYGSSAPIDISYYRNDHSIISYTVSDLGGTGTSGSDSDDDDDNTGNYGNGKDGSGRSFTGLGFISGGDDGQDIVAIMDIPAQASYLKEFFDVRLHIINNSSSEFSLDMNEINLNVPEGMTLMTSVENGYQSSEQVKIDSIKGQETVTLAWVLRGDEAGEYNLSADYTGTLSEFDELVTARFETETPIKVYGMEGVVFRVLAADEIHGDTLYFNVELENARDIDIYMPSIGLTDKIQNVTESAINGDSSTDSFAEAYILNIYVENENGAKQYMPFSYDDNGNVILGVDTLAPGQKLVYEYVSYNASNYGGTSYFEDAVITEFEGVFENIEVGSFTKELYSFKDYSEKLDAILSEENTDVTVALDYIMNDSIYYYIQEAESGKGNVCEALYKISDLVLSGDVSIFTQDEEKDMIKTIILSMLADSSVVEQVEDLVMVKYTGAVEDMIKHIEDGVLGTYLDDERTSADVAEAFAGIIEDSKNLAVIYRSKGSEEFKKELNKQILGYSLGIGIDVADYLTSSDENVSLSKVFDVGKDCVTGVLNAVAEAEREQYYYAVLKTQCNADIGNYILDAIIDATLLEMPEDLKAKIENGDILTFEDLLALDDYTTEFIGRKETMVYFIAKDMKTQLNENMDAYYENWNTAVNMLEEGTEIAAEYAIKLAMKAALGTTVFGLISAGFSILDAVFGFESYTKQQDTFDVYSLLSGVFKDMFHDSVVTRDEETDFYSMIYLRALCEIRLDGEVQFRAFMDDYLNGVYVSPLSEEEVLGKINEVMGTTYTSYNQWNDDIQYNITHSRDLMFNIENTSVNVPRAPGVSLDYDNLQTVQSFTDEYEYCFADGVWRTCENAPIAFEVSSVPSVLRVRVAASDTNLAGEITTVKIYARKDLSKLISVKFDGVNYTVDNLSAAYNYQIAFVNSVEEDVDWSSAKIVSGSSSTVAISGVAVADYMVIRSLQNSLKYETTSNPLYVAVDKKQTLDLVIDGNGTVFQSDDSGRYFNGDSIDLIAKASEGEEFLGWYIDSVCVSTDNYYIVEMTDDLQITAMFSGAKIQDITISQLPSDLEYEVGEYPDLTELEVLVTYTDGTTAVVNQYAACLSSNLVGQTSVTVAYGGCTTSYNVSIVSKEQEAIQSAEQVFFKEESSIADFIKENGEAFEYKIYVDGQEVKTEDLFSTGMVMTVENPATSEVTAMEIIVYGDINGDGKVSTKDYMCVRGSLAGVYAMNDAKFAAADVDNSGNVSASDYMKIKSHINGLYDLFADVG